MKKSFFFIFYEETLDFEKARPVLGRILKSN